ncbi:histidine phosphatase family protein [Streptacidiphilus sp. PB12-B1b]|uniref:histidine phosphatase family protein n=1 Tax=Streptacidiphilus sp. PB12-B1b TaxID=2705012 RepID=UPI001CDBD701|nr:histidine phosphatase family protein [Streptacidiphilus sp. PB12-B1b]QMU79213.1 histidine phosphatase family protein [Streptacidiphilus sp. PB12-B1b]
MELTNHRSTQSSAQGGHATRAATLPLSLTVVRHGQSTANAAFEAAEAVGALDVGIGCRDADLRLTALGRSQAEALGRWIASRGGGPVPQSLWVSPYLRAQETAEAVLAAFDDAGLPLPDVRTDERLRDRELGVLEMLTSAAIELHHPGEAARRRLLGELRWRPPGGESCADVALRLRSLLRDLYEEEPDRRVLLVAHDAVVLMLRHIIDGLDEAELIEVAGTGAVGNTSVTRWSRSGEGRLQLDCYATTPHLE